MDYTGLINIQAQGELNALRLSGQQLNAFGQAMDETMRKIASTPPMAAAASKALRDLGVSAQQAAQVGQAIRGQAGPNAVAQAQTLRAQIGQLQSQIRAALHPNQVSALRNAIGTGLATAAAQASTNIQRALGAPLALAQQAAQGVIRHVQGIGAALMRNLQPARLQEQAIAASARAAHLVTGAVTGIGRALKGVIMGAAVLGTLFTVNAVKGARAFEAELAKINTIARETPQGMTAIGDILRDLAVEMGEPLYDITDSFYDLLSANLSVADSLVVVRQSAILAVGGIGGLHSAVDLMTSAWNAFRLDQQGAEEAMNIFAAAVERGKVRIDQIGETFSTVAPLASAMGLGINEIGAAYATLTGQGFSAGEAMTGMRSAMIGLQRQNVGLRDAMRDTGKDFTAIAQEKGLQQAMIELREYSEETGVPMIKLLGRIEGVQYALSVTGKNAEPYREMLDYMNVSAKTGETALGLYQRRMESFDRVVRIFQQAFLDLSIEWGTALLPPLTAFVTKITDVVKTITEWMKANRDLVSTFAPVVTALTTIIGLRVGLSALLTVVPGVTHAFTALGIGTGSAFAAIASLLGPVLIIAGALAGLAIAIDNNVAGLGQFGDVLEPLGNIADTVGQAFHDLTTGGAVDFGAMLEDIAEQAGILGGRIADHIVESAPDVLAAVQEIGTVVVDRLMELVPQVVEAGQELFASAADWVSGNADAIVAAVGGVVTLVTGAIAEYAPRVLEAVRGWAEAFIEWAPEAIDNALDALGDVVVAMTDWIKSNEVVRDIASALTEWAVAFAEWVPEATRAALEALPDLISTVTDFLLEAVPALVGAAISIGGDVIQGIIDGIIEDPGRVAKALGGLLTTGVVIAAFAAAGAAAAAAYRTAFIAASAAGSWITGAVTGAVSRGVGLFSAAGHRLGIGMGGVFAAAFAAVAWVEVFNTYNRIQAGLEGQLLGISDQVAGVIADGTNEELAQTKIALEDGLKELDKVWDAGIFTNNARDKLRANLDAVNKEIETRPAFVMPEVVIPEVQFDPGAIDAAVEAAFASSAGLGPSMFSLDLNAEDPLKDLMQRRAAYIAESTGILESHVLTLLGTTQTAEELATALKNSEGAMAGANTAAMVATQQQTELALRTGQTTDAIDAQNDAITNRPPPPPPTIDSAMGTLRAWQEEVAAGLVAGKETVYNAALEMLAALPESISGQTQHMVELANQLPADIADALESGYAAIKETKKSLKAALKEALENPMDTTARVMKIKGQLASKWLADGLASNDPYIRAKAERVRQRLEEQLANIEDTARLYGIHTGQNWTDGMVGALAQDLEGKDAAERQAILQGELTGKGLAKGLKSKDPLVRQAARRYKRYLKEQIQLAKKAAATGAEATGKAYGDNLGSPANIQNVKDNAKALAGAAAPYLHATSPPGPASPLHRIGDWAAATGRWYALQLAKTTPFVAAAAEGMAAGAAKFLMPEPLAGATLGPATYSDYGSQNRVSMPYDPVNDANNAILREQTRELRLNNQLMAQLVAQEPEAAEPITARGALAKEEFLMPGGRV